MAIILAYSKIHPVCSFSNISNFSNVRFLTGTFVFVCVFFCTLSPCFSFKVLDRITTLRKKLISAYNCNQVLVSACVLFFLETFIKMLQDIPTSLVESLNGIIIFQRQILFSEHQAPFAEYNTINC